MTSSNVLPDIRQTHTFYAPIGKVWDAVATSEGLAAWFMPNDFKAVVGHEFELNAGPFGMSPCKVTVVEPPNKVSFRWGKDWTLTFELIDKGDQTEFTLIHSGWGIDQVTEFGQSHAEVRERMLQGWSGLGPSLGKYVEAQ